jgi:hypothetical protein
MSSISGSFVRMSPADFAQKIGILPGWFVISHHHMKDKKQRRFAHGCWYKIVGENERSVFRVLRFSPRLSAGKNDNNPQIVIDWPAWLELSDFDENTSKPIHLEIKKANWYFAPALAVSHPDPSTRLAGWLGLISIGLGLLSVVLAIVL